MDGSRGCCTARYGYDDVMSQMDRIMLRFRPIAPKPPSTASVSDTSKATDSGGYVKAARRWRKRKRKPCAVAGEMLSGKPAVQDNKMVTLPLLPETPDLIAKAPPGQKKMHVWLSFDGNNSGCWTRQRAVAGTWVIVESVTDTWGEVTMGRTDEDKRRGLEEDTCPGFISDCWNRVWWANNSYKRMASGRGGGDSTASLCDVEEVAVWLVMREKPPPNCEAFTCRVTVQSRSTKVVRTSLPCDVWRLSDGGFAWRLDVKAALSLGR